MHTTQNFELEEKQYAFLFMWKSYIFNVFHPISTHFKMDWAFPIIILCTWWHHRHCKKLDKMLSMHNLCSVTGIEGVCCAGNREPRKAVKWFSLGHGSDMQHLQYWFQVVPLCRRTALTKITENTNYAMGTSLSLITKAFYCIRDNKLKWTEHTFECKSTGKNKVYFTTDAALPIEDSIFFFSLHHLTLFSPFSTSVSLPLNYFLSLPF